jgi:hypothetical protein
MNVGVTPPKRQTTLRLNDGRSLAWSEWGPANGLPVLFCTGAAMSGSLGFGADALADTSTVHSPDFGATRFLEPQEGGSILWTRARDIL